MLVKLPNGLVEAGDHFNLVEVDELRGRHQNYLADKDLVIGNIGHIPKLLDDLVLSVQTEAGVKWKGSISEVIKRLPSNDLETILIKVRENTYGPRFYHEAQCPNCGKVIKNLRLDLDTLEVKYLSLQDLMASKTMLLPKSQMEVELKPMYLADLFEIIKITKDGNSKLITSLSALSVKRLGDKSPVQPEDIDNIPATDLMALQEFMASANLEGTIDTNLELDCSDCKKEFSTKLNCFDPSFFAPTKGSMNTIT